MDRRGIVSFWVVVLIAVLAALIYFEIPGHQPWQTAVAVPPPAAGSTTATPSAPAEASAPPATAASNAAPAAPSPAAPGTQVAAGEPAPAVGATAPAAIVPPTFDVVRVEPSGDTVVAGQADPGSKVELLDGASSIATAEADDSGAWAMALDKPLAPGSHDLAIRTTSKDKAVATLSDQRVTVSVPEKGSKDVLVVLDSPNAPSKVLEVPGGTTPAAPGTAIASATPANEPAAAGTPSATTPAASGPAAPSGNEVASAAPAASAPAGAAPAASGNAAASAEATPPPAAPATSPASPQVATAEPQAAPAAGTPATSAASPAATATDTTAPAAPSSGTQVATAEPPIKTEPPIAAEPAIPKEPAIAAEPAIPAEPPVAVAPKPEVTVATIEADTAGNIYIAGTSATPDPVRVYLDDKPVGDATPSAAGTWLVQTTRDLPAGKYTVRADQIGSGGAVVARSEVPFDREVEVADLKPAATAGAGEAGATVSGTVPMETVVIKHGDNLWRIARGTWGKGIRWSTIYQANTDQIRNPHWIYPGQVFIMPKGSTTWTD